MSPRRLTLDLWPKPPLFSPYNRWLTPQKVCFVSEPMWVQLHSLPLGMMNNFYWKKLGTWIGKVEDIDVDIDGVGWGPFRRIKTWVDITKCLLRGTLLNNEGDQIWIAFKYDRLPSFYFNCRIIKHPDCPKPSINNKIHDSNRNQYDIWLSATTKKSGSNIESPILGKETCQVHHPLKKGLDSTKKILLMRTLLQQGMWITVKIYVPFQKILRVVGKWLPTWGIKQKEWKWYWVRQ